MLRLLMACLCALASIAAAPATAPSSPGEQCDALVAEWQERFEQARMTHIVLPPFVVAGDGGRERLERYVNHTILAAADALHRQFFDRAKPDRPILILLFESDRPYRRLAREWFGDQNVSRFGYFRTDNVMLMNVGTGTGTLVHELTHALIKPDFPQVPSWFNEGLGSLFEQCTLGSGEGGGDIRGLVNWRLPDLQHAIRHNRLRPLQQLISDNNFYDEQHVGLNYAQARYLLMFLQSSNRLTSYYHRFRETHADDPSGLQQLREIISPQSLEDFERDWRKWVLKQRFE